MAVIIVAVVPDPSAPDQTLVVKIRDRHDFETLCDKVRWNLKDSLKRYPPGKPMQFVFFDADRCLLRVSDDQQLARALSLPSKQLHSGRLILYLSENCSHDIKRHPDRLAFNNSKNHEVEFVPPEPTPSFHSTPSQQNLTNATVLNNRIRCENANTLELPISERPYAIGRHAWAVVTQIANGQVTSFVQLSSVLSSISGLGPDTEYPALQYCLHTMQPSQLQSFFHQLLPLIARLALAGPAFHHILRTERTDAAISLTRLQAASIIANIFLCTLTTSSDAWLHRLSMSSLFRSEPFPAVTKIDAILHYLSCCPAKLNRPGSIHVRRQHRHMSKWSMANLLQSSQTTRIRVDSGEVRSSATEVQLEHFYIGHIAAAALGPDTTTDILRLFETPELLAASALCDPLARYDSIVVSGARHHLSLTGSGEKIRIQKVWDEDVETTVVLYKSKPDNSNKFHPKTLLDDILQAVAAMSAVDVPTIALKSKQMQSPHQIDLDRDFIIDIIAAMLSNRNLVYYIENDGRMASYPNIANLLAGVRAADMTRFLMGYRPSMGPIWARVLEFLQFDQSVTRRQ